MEWLILFPVTGTHSRDEIKFGGLGYILQAEIHTCHSTLGVRKQGTTRSGFLLLDADVFSQMILEKNKTGKTSLKWGFLLTPQRVSNSTSKD